jgi:trehalose synthase
VPALAARGNPVIWRAHIGVDEPNRATRKAWAFLRPYVSEATALVFSRSTYVWEGLDPKRTHIIPPSIDAFATKNQELSPAAVGAILDTSGITHSPDGEPRFLRHDGTPGLIKRSHQSHSHASFPAGAQIVLQVSRWDPLKDPAGVMDGFVRHIAPHSDSHLVLAGPASRSVADDPEQPQVLRELEERRRGLEAAIRPRVHLVELPMEDEEENAAIVNALQRRADVVVQKSLVEGFGLTVAEAMWKSRPVVASRVGGIEDQLEDGRTGLLVDDPRDLGAFGGAVVRLLRDGQEARRLGLEARRHVERHFLAPRHLMQQGALIRSLL